MVKKLIGSFVLGVVLTLAVVFGLHYLNSSSQTKAGAGADALTGNFIAVGSGGSSDDGSSGRTAGAGGSGSGVSATAGQGLGSVFGNLLLKIIELRNCDDKVNASVLVTEIDAIVHGTNSQPIIDKWESVALCLAGECSDMDFTTFILAVCLEAEKAGISKATLIVNILTADKYWNTDNTVKFSQALSYSNSAITGLNDAGISAKWTEFVKCDGKCKSKNDILFDLLKEIVA